MQGAHPYREGRSLGPPGGYSGTSLRNVTCALDIEGQAAPGEGVSGRGVYRSQSVAVWKSPEGGVRAGQSEEAEARPRRSVQRVSTLF